MSNFEIIFEIYYSRVKIWKFSKRMIEIQKIEAKLRQLDAEFDDAGESDIEVQNEISR